MGWDATAKVWRKLVCNAAGKLIIDPSEILEDNPTDNEVGKAPTSNWAFDHKADASAHHTKFTITEHDTPDRHALANLDPLVCSEAEADSKISTHKADASAHHSRYTDAESRAAIGNLLDSNGVMLKTLNAGYNSIDKVYGLIFKGSPTATRYTLLTNWDDDNIIRVVGYASAGGYQPAYIDIFNGTGYERVVVVPVMDAAILAHKNIADAHHSRYTDAEAKAAVGYNGTKYWSCPGIHFDPMTPASEDITKTNEGSIVANATGIYLKAAVSLPHGATVTSAIVNGNASSESNTWELYALKLSDRSRTQMAWNYINSADNSITQAAVDNSTYAYFLRTSSLAAADEIWGAKITYTL